MKTAIAVVALLLIFGAAAIAYQYPMVPFVNGLGPMLNGGFDGPMIPNANGGGSPVGGCVGAADFSDGCAVAIFGH